MYKTQDVVSEAQDPQLGGNADAPSNERFERRGTVRAEVHQIIREISAATGSDVTVADVMGRSRFQYIGQFAASLFHVNDEECADLSAIALENSKTAQAAE